MNQKIKELYNKSLEKYTYSDCDGDNNHGIRLNEEKFAELIIKECAKIALGDRGLGDYKKARESAMADIFNHFEVAKIENLKDRTWI